MKASSLVQAQSIYLDRLELYSIIMANWKDLRAFKQASLNMVLAIFVMSVSVFSYGFDNSVFSTIQAMDGMVYDMTCSIHLYLTPPSSIRKAIWYL